MLHVITPLARKIERQVREAAWRERQRRKAAEPVIYEPPPIRPINREELPQRYDQVTRFRAVCSGRQILQQQAQKYAVTVLAIMSQARNRGIVLVRHETMFRMADETLLSLPQIGRIIGGRDHSTVIKGIARHCKRNNVPLPRTPNLGEGKHEGRAHSTPGTRIGSDSIDGGRGHQAS